MPQKDKKVHHPRVLKYAPSYAHQTRVRASSAPCTRLALAAQSAGVRGSRTRIRGFRGRVRARACPPRPRVAESPGP